MTFKEFGVKKLFSMGMFENQAEAVMEKVISDSKTNKESPNIDMKDRWDDDITGYPECMLTVLFIAIKPFALEWIKENMPEAWYRPMFDSEHPLNKEFNKK